MKIEKLRIKNFKVYQDTEIRDLPNLCVFLGANGSGKSTLFDIFQFLKDALNSNIKIALNQRGGFNEVCYKNEFTKKIEIEIQFKDINVYTYRLKIGSLTDKNEVFVESEGLELIFENSHINIFHFSNGVGNVLLNENEIFNADFEPNFEINQTLDSSDILALKGLGQFQKYKSIAQLRRFFENWHISNFQIHAAQTVEDTGLSEHLSTTGNNLAQVTKYIFENYPETFQHILDKMKARVPGIEKVEASETIDGRIVLQFRDGSFKDPFISRFVSDGTIKMFAYLVLLNDPQPHPLLCIEEPENYLHPELLLELAEEFRDYANKGGQVFVSSHSPDFVNALELQELFWLQKENGHTTIKRASDDEMITNLKNEGEPLGALWKQGYLLGSGPKKR